MFSFYHNLKLLCVFSEAIAINQDPAGIQGRRMLTKNNIDVWTRQLSVLANGNTEYAVAFISLRTDGQPYRVVVNLADIGLKNDGGFILNVSNS